MNKNLRRRIMARIYFEYTKNTFREYPDYFMFALFLVTAFMLVSVRDVLTNIPKDNIPGVLNFFIVAFRDTSLVLQILIGGFLARILVSGSIFTYKNINTRWSIAKLIRLRY